jgi:hypothetical protein
MKQSWAHQMEEQEQEEAWTQQMKRWTQQMKQSWAHQMEEQEKQ